MADEVERILNDLGDELKGLSRVLQSTFKIFDKGNKGEAEYQKQVNEQRRRFLDVLKKEGKITEETYNAEIKNTTATKKSTSAIGNATSKVVAFADSLGLATSVSLKELGAGFINTAKNFGLADRKIDGFGDALKGFDGLQVLGLKLSDLGDTLDFNVGIFKQLSQTGAGFGKSVIQLRNAATSANMPILDFVDLIQTNSGTFARLFGTIMDGMPTIQGFTRSLRDRTRNELAEFGLNLDETSEFLVTQLEIQRARGNAERVSQMDLVSRTVEYAKNLTKLSKLTGIQVSELDANNRQLAIEGTFQASLMQLNQKGRDATTRATAVMEDLSPELATVIKDITQFGVATLPVSKAFQVGSPQIIEFIKQLNQGTIDSAEFISKVKGASNTIGTDFAKSFADAGRFGLEGAEEYLNAIAKLAGSGNDTAGKQMKQVGDNTALLVGFGETIDTLKTQAESVSTDVFGKILGDDKGEGIGLAFKAISDAVQGLSGDSFLGNFAKAFDSGLSALRVVITKKAGAVKEFVTKGEDGKGLLENVLDNDPNRAGIQVFGKSKGPMEIAPPTRQDPSEYAVAKPDPGPLYRQGTDGFKDFGSGTAATLHGIEAVVPKNDFAQLAKVVEQMSGNTGPTPVDTSNPNAVNTDRYLAELVELNKNTERALNTLVTIGAMTEKNTKNMNNTVANMGGSLV